MPHSKSATCPLSLLIMVYLHGWLLVSHMGELWPLDKQLDRLRCYFACGFINETKTWNPVSSTVSKSSFVSDTLICYRQFSVIMWPWPFWLKIALTDARVIGIFLLTLNCLWSSVTELEASCAAMLNMLIHRVGHNSVLRWLSCLYMLVHWLNIGRMFVCSVSMIMTQMLQTALLQHLKLLKIDQAAVVPQHQAVPLVERLPQTVQESSKNSEELGLLALTLWLWFVVISICFWQSKLWMDTPLHQLIILIIIIIFNNMRTLGDLKNRSDIVLRPNFALRLNLHKFFKWQQAFGLRPKLWSYLQS